MAINLTLNDFRNVLGKVNDGNIVFKQDQSGIEKANYGSKIPRREPIRSSRWNGMTVSARNLSSPSWRSSSTLSPRGRPSPSRPKLRPSLPAPTELPPVNPMKAV